MPQNQINQNNNGVFTKKKLGFFEKIGNKISSLFSIEKKPLKIQQNTLNASFNEPTSVVTQTQQQTNNTSQAHVTLDNTQDIVKYIMSKYGNNIILNDITNLNDYLKTPNPKSIQVSDKIYLIKKTINKGIKKFEKKNNITIPENNFYRILYEVLGRLNFRTNIMHETIKLCNNNTNIEDIMNPIFGSEMPFEVGLKELDLTTKAKSSSTFNYLAQIINQQGSFYPADKKTSREVLIKLLSNQMIDKFYDNIDLLIEPLKESDLLEACIATLALSELPERKWSKQTSLIDKFIEKSSNKKHAIRLAIKAAQMAKTQNNQLVLNIMQKYDNDDILTTSQRIILESEQPDKRQLNIGLTRALQKSPIPRQNAQLAIAMTASESEKKSRILSIILNSASIPTNQQTPNTTSNVSSTNALLSPSDILYLIKADNNLLNKEIKSDALEAYLSVVSLYPTSAEESKINPIDKTQIIIDAMRFGLNEKTIIHTMDIFSSSRNSKKNARITSSSILKHAIDYIKTIDKESGIEPTNNVIMNKFLHDTLTELDARKHEILEKTLYFMKRCNYLGKKSNSNKATKEFLETFEYAIQYNNKSVHTEILKFIMDNNIDISEYVNKNIHNINLIKALSTIDITDKKFITDSTIENIIFTPTHEHITNLAKIIKNYTLSVSPKSFKYLLYTPHNSNYINHKIAAATEMIKTNKLIAKEEQLLVDYIKIGLCTTDKKLIKDVYKIAKENIDILYDKKILISQLEQKLSSKTKDIVSSSEMEKIIGQIYKKHTIFYHSGQSEHGIMEDQNFNQITLAPNSSFVNDDIIRLFAQKNTPSSNLLLPSIEETIHSQNKTTRDAEQDIRSTSATINYDSSIESQEKQYDKNQLNYLIKEPKEKLAFIKNLFINQKKSKIGLKYRIKELEFETILLKEKKLKEIQNILLAIKADKTDENDLILDALEIIKTLKTQKATSLKDEVSQINEILDETITKLNQILSIGYIKSKSISKHIIQTLNNIIKENNNSHLPKDILTGKKSLSTYNNLKSIVQYTTQNIPLTSYGMTSAISYLATIIGPILSGKTKITEDTRVQIEKFTKTILKDIHRTMPLSQENDAKKIFQEYKESETPKTRDDIDGKQSAFLTSSKNNIIKYVDIKINNKINTINRLLDKIKKTPINQKDIVWTTIAKNTLKQFMTTVSTEEIKNNIDKSIKNIADIMKDAIANQDTEEFNENESNNKKHIIEILKANIAHLTKMNEIKNDINNVLFQINENLITLKDIDKKIKTETQKNENIFSKTKNNTDSMRKMMKNITSNIAKIDDSLTQHEINHTNIETIIIEITKIIRTIDEREPTAHQKIAESIIKEINTNILKLNNMSKQLIATINYSEKSDINLNESSSL